MCWLSIKANMLILVLLITYNGDYALIFDIFYISLYDLYGVDDET